MQKKKYTRGIFPVRGVGLPPVVDELSGGLILDLPDHNIKEYLQSKLDLKWMPTDEELVNNLENLIEEHMKKRKNRALVPDEYVDSTNLDAHNLLELPGFNSLDPVKRELLRRKFQQVLDRPLRRTTTKTNKLDQL
jgi:hypothetical protein